MSEIERIKNSNRRAKILMIVLSIICSYCFFSCKKEEVSIAPTEIGLDAIMSDGSVHTTNLHP